MRAATLKRTALLGTLIGLLAWMDAPTVLAGEGGPVILELFTSQGCSSCPAADRLLSRLGSGADTRARVLPLAFHVDYWNRIGWKDPFSGPKWTARQERYSRAFGLDSGYTPQLVVGGRVQLVGSQESRVLKEIAAESARETGASISLRSGDEAPGALTVDVAVLVEQRITADKLELLVAVFESGLVTPVARGENRGRTLRNDFVVRRLLSAFSLEPNAGARRQKVLKIDLEHEWKLENLGVTAFLQDPGTMKIYAAAVQHPKSGPPSRLD